MYYDQEVRSGFIVDGFYAIISSKGMPGRVENPIYKYVADINFYPSGMQYSAAEWCEENCEGGWLIGATASGFTNEQDFMAFKLRWL